MGIDGAKQLRAKDLLTNAADTIAERSKTHGHYDLTMLRTSKLWSDYLEREIEPIDVARFCEPRLYWLIAIVAHVK